MILVGQRIWGKVRKCGGGPQSDGIQICTKVDGRLSGTQRGGVESPEVAQSAHIVK